MKIQNFAVKYILAWFQRNRPELDMREDGALAFYQENKNQLNLTEIDNDREAMYLLLGTFLEKYYSDPTNKVCFEVVQEPEFFYVTSELQAVGFLYTEEMESLILQVKNAEWYEDFVNDKSLLENEEFKEKVRNVIRPYWDDLL